MKILVHASLDFKQEMISYKDEIEKNSCHTVILPNLIRYQSIRDDNGDDATFTKIKNGLTIENFHNVEECDCLLILNYDHNGYKNYIGGNSFMEMVIAFYLKKPIYLIHSIPENMPYTEEIKALYPTVLNNISELFSK